MSDFAVETGSVPGPRSREADQPATTQPPAADAPEAAVTTDDTITALPALAAAALAVASGLALWLAFPGHGLWPLAVVGVAGLALVTRGQRSRRGAWLGFVAGMAFFGPHLKWSGIYVGDLPWIALAALEAGYIALLGALAPWVWRAHVGRGRGAAALTVLGTAGLWVAQEALRGRTPFGGFPWGRLAFSQADAPTLGLASVGGAPLVSAAVAAAGGCLAVAVVAAVSAVRRRGTSRRSGVLALLAAVAAVAVTGLGALVPRAVDAPRSAQIAAVQGNVPTAGLDFNAQRRAVLDNHVTATLALGRQIASGATPRPDVVLWPENASDIDPLRNEDAYREIQATTDTLGVPVLVGAVLEEPADHLSNASIVWNPMGSADPGPSGDYYVKRHPAPFGEYIPYRSFFRNFSDKVDLVRRDFWPGTRVGVLPANGLRLGAVICFEVAYDDLVRDPVRGGADLLVVQTNNATFGYTDESVQQLAMSRLRAVETGRSVVHISTVGVSALIAPDGSMVRTSGHFTQDVLQARLPLRTGQTLATRLDGVPEYLLSGLGVLVAAGGLLAARRRRPAEVAR